MKKWLHHWWRSDYIIDEEAITSFINDVLGNGSRLFQLALSKTWSITRQLEDLDFLLPWQEQYLTARSSLLWDIILVSQK